MIHLIKHALIENMNIFNLKFVFNKLYGGSKVTIKNNIIFIS